MPDVHFEAPNLIYWAIPAFILLLLVEAIVSAIDRRELFEVKDTVASLAMGIGNVLTNLFAKAVVLGAFWIVYEYAGFFKTKNIHTYNPVRIAFHEWQAIWRDVRRPLPWKARLAYVFGPPGWSHDGSRKTTDELRAERHARHGEAS